MKCDTCDGTGRCPCCDGEGVYTPDSLSARSNVTVACRECEVYRDGMRVATGKCLECDGREWTIEELEALQRKILEKYA